MIPEGWTPTELGTLADFTSGGTPSKQKDDFWGGSFPWVSAKDLKKHVIDGAELGLTDAGKREANTAPVGAVLVLVRGMTLLKDVPIGYAAKPVAFNQDIKALIAKGHVDPKFLAYLLVSLKRPLMSLVNTANHGTGRLDTNLLKAFPVILPPIEEQRRIAKRLEAWDRAIEAVEALIANARAQKQALMQQLLPQGTTPPKKRLPGFSGEWKRVSLEEIGTISSAGVDKKIVKGEAEVRLLNFLDAYKREFIHDADLTQRVTAPKAKLQGCNVLKGDVFFTPSSETRDDIALAAVAAEDMPSVVYSYHVVRFRPAKKLDLNFSAYLFQTDDFKRQAYRLGDGSGQRYVISQPNFRKMHVSVPGIDEQAAIGSLLADHSTAIADYKAKLTALRQEKAALMQQLLTGKRRVKLSESEVA